MAAPSLAAIPGRHGRRTRARVAALRGALLVSALSFAPIYFMGLESLAERRARERYDVQPLQGSLATWFHGHHVEVGDRYLGFGGQAPPYVEGPVSIRVDGRDYSIAARLRISTAYRDRSRYWNFLGMGTLVDRADDRREFFIVQCLPVDSAQGYPASMSWRILFIRPDGEVVEEVFGFRDRARPLYRTLLARTASPASLGFHSQILADLPSALFPFAFPVATFLASSVVMEVLGLAAVLGRDRPRAGIGAPGGA